MIPIGVDVAKGSRVENGVFVGEIVGVGGIGVGVIGGWEDVTRMAILLAPAK